MGSRTDGGTGNGPQQWAQMNVATVSFTTRLRTWLLVAGLTALLVVVGLAIGGGFLYIFVGLAVLMNVAGYWWSDRIALKVSRARPLERADAPTVYADVEDLVQRAGLPMPRLFVIPSEQPNAFATGRSPKHAAVASARNSR